MPISIGGLKRVSEGLFAKLILHIWRDEENRKGKPRQEARVVEWICPRTETGRQYWGHGFLRTQFWLSRVKKLPFHCFSHIWEIGCSLKKSRLYQRRHRHPFVELSPSQKLTHNAHILVSRVLPFQVELWKNWDAAGCAVCERYRTRSQVSWGFYFPDPPLKRESWVQRKMWL